MELGGTTVEPGFPAEDQRPARRGWRFAQAMISALPAIRSPESVSRSGSQEPPVVARASRRPALRLRNAGSRPHPRLRTTVGAWPASSSASSALRHG